MGNLKTSGYFFRYCLGASAAIYIFDGNFCLLFCWTHFFPASKRSSFEKVEQWISENEKSEIAVKVLVGNKVPL